MDEHRHPPVRLFDRAARPIIIITPHARLPYSMPRVVLYHAESEACLRPLGTIAVDHKCPLVDLVFALPQAYPAAALDGDHEQEHEDVGSRLHHCQVSMVNN